MSTLEISLLETQPFKIEYGAELEAEIKHLQNEITRHVKIADQFPHRWLAIKLLEEDQDIQIKLLALEGGASLIKVAQEQHRSLEKSTGR